MDLEVSNDSIATNGQLVDSAGAGSPHTPAKKTMLLGVFRHKDFTRLWSGQLISNLGDAFNTLAMAWLVKITTGSTVLMGLVLAANTTAIVTVGFFSGAIVDHTDKRLTLMRTDALRALMVALLSILYHMQVLHSWMIVLFSLVMGGASAFFGPAKQSILPRIVEANEFTQANSFAMLTQQLSTFIGPTLAGISVSYWGVEPAFWIDAASYGVSFVAIAFMGPQPSSLSTSTNPKMLQEIKEGFAVMIQHPILRWVAILAILGNFIYGPVSVLLPFLAGQLSHNGAAALPLSQLLGGVLAHFLSIQLVYVAVAAGLLAQAVTATCVRELREAR